MTAHKLACCSVLLAALASISCRSENDTTIVIHVISDAALSLESVEMTARHLASASGAQSASGSGLPTKTVVFNNPASVTWELFPAGGDKSFAVEVEAVGRAGDHTVITQRAVISFQKGQRLEITMSLDDACLNVDCRSPLTCEHGACIDPMFVGVGNHPGGTGGTMGTVEPPATDGGVGHADGPETDVRPGSKALGETCTANGDCASTHCADGVCCNEVCGGSCQQCNLGTMRGTCQAIAAGQPAPAGRPACTAADVSTCKQTGLCDGKGACQLFADGQICKAATCDATANTLTESRCDGMGTCKPGTPITCAPFRCRAGQAMCARMCTANTDCDGQPCLANSCGKLRPGAACAADTDCELGFCTDGVCCDVRCAGQCQACNLSTSVGTCSNLRSGQPVGGRTACTGTGTCGGSCTGQSACSFPDSMVSCRAASCDVSTLTQPAGCNGAGACPAVSTSACPGQLRCRAGMPTCILQCTTSADCVTGFFCSGTTCAPSKANGMTCTLGTECATGQCVDGVCCNTACNAACQTCATGTCGMVLGAEDAPSCTGTMICSATGACGKKLGQTCAAGSECASGQCVDGHCCNTTCTGSCLTCATGTCSPVVNGPDVGTCSGTMTCNGQGTCVSTQGQVCTVAGDCANGMCVDGRCCNTTCTGNCLTCITGTCSPVLSADDLGTCSGTMTCNGAGVCAKRNGQTCTVATECATGQCVDGHCCDTTCAGNCLTCATGTCSPVRNAEDAGTCSGVMVCNASGVCTKRNGQTCTLAAECATGQCVDGHCCDTTCTGNCLTCATGTCSAVRSAEDSGTCSGTMICDANGVCTKKLGQTCAGGTECVMGFCTDGHCCDTACTATCFTCATGTCSRVTNGDDNTCTGATTCNASGVCVRRQGQACTADTDCLTGQCADGVCCDRDCMGACEACSAAGVCGFVTGAPHAGHPACTGGTAPCARTCRGASAACVFPGTETSCRTQTCSGTTVTLASSCDGLGNCPTTTRPCNPYVCGMNNACLMNCLVNSQCVGTGIACVGGVCTACPAGQMPCPGVPIGCVNLSDVANCGACGRTCSAGQTCFNQACCTPIPMTTACTGRCGTVSDGCGGSYTCTCATGEVCGANGMPGICCRPLTRMAACLGKACGQVGDGCGGPPFMCTNTCIAFPNTTVACSSSNTCVRGCELGNTPLACSTPALPVCGFWDFESMNSEGWVSTDPLQPSPTQLRASRGGQALHVPLAFTNSTTITISVPLCAPMGINALGKTLRAHLFFVSDTPLAISPADGVFVAIEVAGPAGALARAAQIDAVPTPQVDLVGTLPTNFTAPVTQLQLVFRSELTGWTGFVAMDDVHIEGP